MTAQDNADAVLAAVNAALPAAVRAYDIDKVPASRPRDHVVIDVNRRFGGALNLGAQSRVVGYRVTCRAVSQSSIANVRDSLERCRAALEGVRLTVGAERTTPIQFETSDPPGDDDGWFSGLDVYTYALTR